MTYTREQLQSLFQAPFDDAAWTEFLHVFFGAGKLYAIPDLLEKKDDAAGFLLGEFETADSYRVGLFRFDITRGSILRRKSGLRALADRFLRGHGFDAAIAVFVQDGSAEWRFSYICDIKGAETAPRRFTYVFGDKAQNYRTPVERFAKLQSAGISQSNLDEAFSVEALSKQFYSELQDWYFWALTKVVWPDDLPELKNKETRNATPTIRLITRLIFVWFLKQKGIVPAKLFDEKTVKDWLNNTDATGSTYYKAILQNLFFATLNLDPEESPREFQKYGQKGVTAYRYKRFFKKDAAQQFCETCHEIPFLNGGLFENLDKNTETDIPLRVDCFSNLTENEPRLAVPDELFFGKEQTVDLSVFFDSDRKKSSVKTHGLFHILNAYNFTVEENTPFDKAVALDPELLGQIFENLLASFNPETRNTARKETGSFYTPREIVQYMVDESLIAYLKTRVENAPEEEIRNLTSYAGVENRLTDAQRKEIAEALFNAKIFDPACGSGAFPMGMLQQMVHILAQVDPKNAQLKTLAIKKAMEDCESSLGTHTDGGESMEQKLAAVGRVFDETREHPDYVRKLHLIENCLYGSDIQPIAVQITKLRFFISLVCEQDNKQADNEQADNAILPLPNLETNFVAANTLVGIHKPKNWADEDDDKTRELKEELRRIRHAHFSARRTAQKKSLRKDDENTRKQLQAHLLTLAPLPDKHRLETYQDQLVKAEQERKAVSAEKWEEVAGTAEEKDMFGNITRPAGLPLRVDVNQPKREKLDAQIRALEQGIQAELSKSANIAFAEEAEKLAHWDPYDQNAASAFFDTEWMFGIKEGFDIVMGNPPYIQLQNNGGELANVYKNADFKTFERTGDIYTLFYERGFQLLRDKAHLCFITSNKWMRAGYGESLRKFLAKSTLP
ncbi:MAG: Eco57I restriction-modification methylase domain-containing protein, partial [Zoogloeaceae bacterium]|nr:Eco57I restriction-modification methylase domain-containing protein [Zoogloeaceae bacterium]